MGVGVDKCRDDATAVGVEDLMRSAEETIVVRRITDEGDLITFATNNRLRNDRYGAEFGSSSSRRSEGRRHLACSPDEEAHP
jgi:hypothetical protein